MKKISIVIPCYNASGKVGRLLQSIVDQSFPLEEMEIILVNDASTDDTWEELLTWERRYPDSICLVNCEENGGIGRARNTGLLYVAGKYVTFCDQDDWIHPDMYRDMYETAEAYQVEMISCDYEEVFHEGECKAQGGGATPGDFLGIITNEEERRTILLTNGMGGKGCNMVWNKLFLRSFLEENNIRFWEERLLGEDIYFMRIFRLYIRRYYMMQNAYYNYFRNLDSTTVSCEPTKYLEGLTREEMFWREYRRRGVLEKYQEIFEAKYIQEYCGIMHYLFSRCDCTAEIISFIGGVIQHVWEKMPDFQQNIYLKEMELRKRIVLGEKYEIFWQMLCSKGKGYDFYAEMGKYRSKAQKNLVDVKKLSITES